MKAFKAFIKPFEAPQRNVKIKIKLNFYFSTTFRNACDGKKLTLTYLILTFQISTKVLNSH